MENVLVARAEELHNKLIEYSEKKDRVGVQTGSVSLYLVPEEVDLFDNEIGFSSNEGNADITIFIDDICNIFVENDIDGLIYSVALKNGNEVDFQFI